MALTDQRSRWTDERLDDLHDDVRASRDNAAETATQVAILNERIVGYRRSQTAQVQQLKREMQAGFAAIHGGFADREKRERDARARRVARRKVALGIVGAAGSVAAIVSTILGLFS